jgi:hypothetical protein
MLHRMVLVACVAVATSCGGGDASTSTGFIAKYCELLAPCCQKAGLPSDGNQCRTLLGAFTAAGAYDRSAGEQCLADMTAASGKPDFCADGTSGSDACDKVFEGGGGGTKKPGETCTQDSDCASSTEGKVECQSRFVMGMQKQQCQIQIKGKEGDTPCVGTVDGNVTSFSSSGSSTDIPARGYLCYMTDNLRCDSTSGSCVKLKASGEMCAGSSLECVKASYCDFAQRKCLDRKATGAMCTSTTECADGNTCATVAPRTCVAQLADGAACTQSDQCRSGRCVNARCEKSSTGDFGLALLCGSK